MKRFSAILVFLILLARPAISDKPPKDSEFVFARVQFTEREYRMYWKEAPWHHDYPYSDEFIVHMLSDLTNVHVSRDSYRIVQLDSPEIFNYPFLYFSEPGFMALTDKEVSNLGEYIRRGGFIMADDFRTAAFLGGPEELEVLRYYLKRAVPEYEFVRLDVQHPVFHAFFDIDTLEMKPPYGEEIKEFVPQFWGLTDPHGNLRLIANYNNDIGEFWQWVDEGSKPFHFAALSVRMGINYIIYSMTH